MKRAICIFCGSSFGNRNEYVNAAEQLADEFIKRNIKLIYGGAKVGLMGVLADRILKQGGEVTGIIPRSLLDKEVAHKNLTELKIVEDMHQRKYLMHEMSDAFIAMPGGFGTLDEIFEAITWGQLEIHKKPCAFYNICNYYEQLIKFIDYTSEEGFVSREYIEMIINEDNPQKLLDRIYSYKHPVYDKAEEAKKQLR
ncbi:MAG: TIGR00730 family Rossman fold protein [Victivallales bacterium]|nr:TIGR00730 family Rossman fold protein [Victivallales bacterium]MCF7888493.1 TIGR00730 family Rossman fold protein [Victivallales bacterium]